MDEIVFAESTVLGYRLAGTVYLLLPLTALLLMYRYRALRLWPATVGAVLYWVSVKLCDLGIGLLFFRLPLAVKTAIAVEFVGIFEEGFRFLGIRFPLTDVRTPQAAVCYGIGHAGLECILRSVQKFRIAGWGEQIGSAGIASFVNDKTPERAAAVTQQLAAYAERSIGLLMLDMLNAVSNFGVHLALTVYLYKKTQELQFRKRWLLTAMLLHCGLNMAFYEVTALVENAGGSAKAAMLAGDLAGLLCGLGIMIFVYQNIGGGSVIDAIRYPLNEDLST